MALENEPLTERMEKIEKFIQEINPQESLLKKIYTYSKLNCLN